MSDKKTVKGISLHFTIPADVDTPSETLAAMKQLCLGALFQMKDRFACDLSREDRALIDALLTES